MNLEYSHNNFMIQKDSYKVNYYERMKEELERNYPNVEERLKHVITPHQMYFNKKQIDEMLVELVESASFSIYGCIDGISEYIERSNISSYYNIIADRITYATILITSDRLLGSLLHIVQRGYLFQYIKSTVVLPNIKSIIKKVSDAFNTIDDYNKQVMEDQKIVDMVKSIINSFTIKSDMDEVYSTLKILDPLIEENRELIETTINGSSIYIPDCLIELLLLRNNVGVDSVSNVERISGKLKEFTTDVKITHTDDGLKRLFKRYTNRDNIDGQIMKTIEEIRFFRGYEYNGSFMDGLTMEEIIVMNKLIQNIELSEQEHSVKEGSYILKNINWVIERYLPTGSTMVINKNSLDILYNNKVTKSFNVKDHELRTKLSDIFNLFNENSLRVKEIFKNNPAASCLTQTVICDSLSKQKIYDVHLSKQPKTMIEKVNHRRKFIELTKHKFINDEVVKNMVRGIEEGEINTIRFIPNVLTSSNFIIKDEKRALYVACELERIYKEISKATATNN
ncbi:MAG: hypothetical protein ACRC92_20695 [Peptostreptococcaceae bacterium]